MKLRGQVSRLLIIRTDALGAKSAEAPPSPDGAKVDRALSTPLLVEGGEGATIREK